MGKMQRSKGSAFERWCVNEIKDHLGYENVRRNLSISRGRRCRYHHSVLGH